jgi:lambda family phage portal protein
MLKPPTMWFKSQKDLQEAKAGIAALTHPPAAPHLLNPIDRIVNYFDPVRGASRTRRSLKQWTTTPGSDADTDILYDLPLLRDRSRDLIRNAPIAAGAIGTSIVNVVGTGLKLQSRIDAEFLGLTGEEAGAWEDHTEREWRLWSESQECDISRTLNFRGLQTLAFRQTLENGDVFALLPRIKRSGSPYTLKVQLVEADRICNENWSVESDTLTAGVQKDPATGAPIAYHVMNQHPGMTRFFKKDGGTWKVVPAFGAKTNLRNVLHLYEVTRPGQTRGVPFLAPVMETLKQLDRYTENELMASVVSSLFTVFLRSEGGGLDFDMTSGMGVETGATASDEDMKLGNGAIIGLKKGEDISTANPGRPNTAFDPFVESILEQIGAALGIPYEVLIRHFQSSYSASRAALLEAWRFFRGRRVWLVENFCQPIYEIWLYEAIASGRIAAPGFFAEALTWKAYCNSLWVGDSPGYVDPQKDVAAAKERLDAKLSTLDEETALITGGDFEANIRQLAKEKRMLKAADLLPAHPPAIPAGKLGKPLPAPEEETEEDPQEEDPQEDPKDPKDGGKK